MSYGRSQANSSGLDERVPSGWQPSLAESSELGVPIDHAVMEPRPPRRGFEDGFSYMTWREPHRLTPAACDQLYNALPVLASRAFRLDSFPYWRERKAERFFDKVSEVTIVLDKRDDIVAWTTMHRQRFDGRSCLYLDSTGVLEQYQHRGFITRLHGYTIVREIRRRPHRPLWVTMRTENPVIYKMLRLGVGPEHLFPSLSGPAPERVQRLGQATADWLGEGADFRRRDLVIEGAYAEAYNRYDEDRLTCGDGEIDAMFLERLAPDEAFVVLAEVTSLRVAAWLAGRGARRARKLIGRGAAS